MEDQVAKQQALQSPETLASVVHAIIRQKYGEEAYDWDPLTVYLEIQADFNVDMDSAATDRWSAIQVIMADDAFFKRPEAFMGICNTLSEGEPFFQIFNPVSVEEAAWGITEVSLNRELLPFSYAVKQYLRQILKADGYNEDNYPAVFREVFETRPEARNIRVGLAAINNNGLVESYIDGQLKDLVYQFDKIQSLKDLDDLILRRSMEEFTGDIAERLKL